MNRQQNIVFEQLTSFSGMKFGRINLQQMFFVGDISALRQPYTIEQRISIRDIFLFSLEVVTGILPGRDIGDPDFAFWEFYTFGNSDASPVTAFGFRRNSGVIERHSEKLSVGSQQIVSRSKLQQLFPRLGNSGRIPVEHLRVSYVVGR